MFSSFVQGFSPVLPVLIILILIILSVFLSWWSYSHLVTVSPLKKWSLISLRSSALIVLALILLNPYVLREYTTREMPLIVVYADNSLSTGVTRGQYSGKDDYDALIQSFSELRDSRFEYIEFLIGDSIRTGKERTLTDGSTNLQETVEHLLQNENRYAAAILFSDGIITRGRTPVFSAQNLSIPVITVPLGDTSTVKDLALADLDYRSPVYTNDRVTITVEIQHRGYGGDETAVLLLENGELMDRRTIQFPAISGTERVEFERIYSEEGFADIEIKVIPFEDEFTTQNNQRSFPLQVIDSNKQILSLAYEIHPDVGAIRRFISSDQQYDLIQSTYLGNERFTGINPSLMEEDPDLIVLHGLPPANGAAYNWLVQTEIPILFFSTPGSYMRLTDPELQRITNFSARALRSQLDIQLAEDSLQKDHPLLEYSPIQTGRLPALNTYSGIYSILPASELLIGALYQGTETDIPFLITSDSGNRRMASVNAYGWNRFALSRQTEINIFFNELIGNLVSWTAASPDRRNLIIDLQKSSFSEVENIQIRATLINERGEPEPDALIELTISEINESNQKIFTMNNVLRGNYELNAGTYPEGAYTITGVATLNGRELGTDETRLLVTETNEEFITTQRNDDLLRQLSALTSGIFLEEKDFSELNRFIIESNLIENRQQTVTDSLFLYRYGYWFFLVLILLTVEWLIRKSISLP